MKLSLLIILAIVSPLSACATEPTVASLYEDVSSAVVGIFTVGREIVVDTDDNYIDEIASEGTGSGVIINDGNVVTAAHLVQTADYVGVQFVDGSRTLATVVASDPFQDLALLKLRSMPEDIHPVALGDSDDVRIGEQIFIIGTPYGFDQSLSGGFISGRHFLDGQSFSVGEVEYFQTDAAINQGTSGAPLFNLDGDVIGIATMILSQSGGSEGLGFAVTSNTAARVLFEKPAFWSGLSGVMLSDEIAGLFNVPQQSGYLIQNVAERSPAERMNILPGSVPLKIGDVELLAGGDILLSIDGIEFSTTSMQEIQDHTAALREGQEVHVQVLRAGTILDLVGVL